MSETFRLVLPIGASFINVLVAPNARARSAQRGRAHLRRAPTVSPEHRVAGKV